MWVPYLTQLPRQLLLLFPDQIPRKHHVNATWDEDLVKEAT
jgi:hypothetical protein